MSLPGWGLTWMVGLQKAILLYFLGINLLYLFLFLLSLWAIIDYLRHTSYRDPREILQSRLTPPLSILVPAHNEATTIVTSIRALFHLRYPKYEILVINDGSTDQTLHKLMETFHLRRTKRIYHKTIPTCNVKDIYVADQPMPWVDLIVIDKEKGGKADALNAGINVSRYPLFCSVDADSILEQDSLLRVAMPFMERFPGTLAVGGIVRVANGCQISEGVVRSVKVPKRWLPRFQTVEYLRAFLSGRVAWSKLKSLLIISGAFGLFKKAPVIEANGYDPRTVGEDMELVVRLHRRNYPRGTQGRIEFIPDPVCWTEVPENLRALWRQRNRWQRGLGQALFRNLPMLLNPRYRLLGLLGVPYFWIVEFLSPVVELLGYLVFLVAILAHVVQWQAFGAFFLLTVLMGMNLSLLAVLLEDMTLHRYPRVRDLLRLFAVAILENLGYRQIIQLARMDGVIDFLRKQNVWGFMERKGLESHA